MKALFLIQFYTIYNNCSLLLVIATAVHDIIQLFQGYKIFSKSKHCQIISQSWMEDQWSVRGMNKADILKQIQSVVST